MKNVKIRHLVSKIEIKEPPNKLEHNYEMHLLKTVKYDGIVRTAREIESRGLSFEYSHYMYLYVIC